MKCADPSPISPIAIARVAGKPAAASTPQMPCAAGGVALDPRRGRGDAFRSAGSREFRDWILPPLRFADAPSDPQRQSCHRAGRNNRHRPRRKIVVPRPLVFAGALDGFAPRHPHFGLISAGQAVNGFFINLTLTLQCGIAIFPLHLISRDRATRLSVDPEQALHLETIIVTSFAPGARGKQR